MVQYVKAVDAEAAVSLLRAKVEQIRQRELDNAGSKLANLAPGVRQEIDRMTGSLVDKILHLPSSELANESNPPKQRFCIDILCRLFNLNQGAKEGAAGLLNSQRLAATERVQ